RGEVVTCGIVLYELIQGIKNPEEEILVLGAMQAVTHLEMSAELWIKAGRLSAQLRKNGDTLPFSDLLIATLALEHDLSVLTIDTHFDLIAGLKLTQG
ncbi:MAG: PIN domain-containing protein, partial [Verrucomicrobia bacterium]|nr:PIN domain-containing protein [Deltaproteobacteria bacterium]